MDIICLGEVNALVANPQMLRKFVYEYIAQFALLGIQLLWTYDMTQSLEMKRMNKKTAMKECSARQDFILK
jgi:hypothetical protein